MNKVFQYIILSKMLMLQISIIYSQNYHLTSPKQILDLPAILTEISGITAINNSTIACVQDEKGILFQYNIDKEKIIEQDSFYFNGDYEGIAKVGNDLYILRSDGLLVEITNALQGEKKVTTYITNVPAADNEGLCYDEKNNQLLIACKSNDKNTTDTKNKKMIYAFDLEKKELAKKPAIEIYVPEIKKYLVDKYKFTDLFMNKFKFMPSAISINPIDGKLYLLSASSFLLCIFKDGAFESALTLDPLIFNKAEGISFFKNGDMVVSNEGQKGFATLLVFPYSKNR